MTVVHNFYCHVGLKLISSFGVIYLVFLLVIPLFPSQLCSLGIFFFSVQYAPFFTCVKKSACRGTVLWIDCIINSVLVCFFFFCFLSYSYSLKNCLLSPVRLFIRVVCFVNFVLLLLC